MKMAESQYLFKIWWSLRTLSTEILHRPSHYHRSYFKGEPKRQPVLIHKSRLTCGAMCLVQDRYMSKIKE